MSSPENLNIDKKLAALSEQDRLIIWKRLLQSLNPVNDAGAEREERLHNLMSRILDYNVGSDSPALLALQRIGDRWSPLILSILLSGSFRHTELQRVVNTLSEIGGMTPISQRILTMKLRTLERDGFVTRKVWPSVPPRTDYSLTPLGQSLAQWVASLVEWAYENGPSIVAAQHDYDQKKS